MLYMRTGKGLEKPALSWLGHVMCLDKAELQKRRKRKGACTEGRKSWAFHSSHSHHVLRSTIYMTISVGTEPDPGSMHKYCQKFLTYL